LGVGVLNSAIFNSFHNRVEFGTIFEGLRNFGGEGGFEPPLGTPLVMSRGDVHHWQGNFYYPSLRSISQY